MIGHLADRMIEAADFARHRPLPAMAGASAAKSAAARVARRNVCQKPAAPARLEKEIEGAKGRD